MGLFSKKKEEIQEAPPAKPASFHDFPRYEPTIKPVEFRSEFRQPEIPIRKPLPRKETFNESVNEKRGNAIFVQVDNYKEAMKTLQQIKEKVSEAEKILSKIESIKEQEKSEIDQWKSDLDSLKEKLSSMYQTLFNESPW